MTRDAFDDIIDINYRKLFIVAYRMLNNQEESEDVVQEVFLKMWTMKEKLDEYKDITALAVTMTKNYSVDILRKMKHIDRRAVEYTQPVEDNSPTPYERMVSDENKDIIIEIIDNLPDQWRDLVQLREINELSYEEISRQKNMNINNLRVILSRARQMIKEKYIKYTYERRNAEGTA